MNSKGARRLIEWGKGLLIVLLMLSAAVLMLRIHGYSSGSVGGLLGQVLGRLVPSEAGGATWPAQTELPQVGIRPVRMAVQSGNGRYGVQYDDAQLDALFEQVGGLLGEALGSAGTARPVSEDEWRAALSLRTGLYFDFLEAVPLDLLERQMGGSATTAGPGGSARRLVLAAGDAATALLYYQNEGDGAYYACETALDATRRLEAATLAFAANNASFAFELTEDYAALDPYVLLLSQTPAPAVYTASNPISGLDEAGRDVLLRALSFQPQASSTYPTVEGQAVLEGGDTLRIGRDGAVMFQAGDPDHVRYAVPEGSDVTRRVEAARQVAEKSLGAWCGAARLYLMGTEQGANGGLTVYFGYLLDGAAVQLQGGGYAARLVLEGGAVTEYTLRFRTYQKTEQSSVVLPEAQAIAAMQALTPGAGRELLLCYTDTGGETVEAGWAVF